MRSYLEQSYRGKNWAGYSPVQARTFSGRSRVRISLGLAVSAAALSTVGITGTSAGTALAANKPILTIGDSETPVSLNPALDYATFYQWRSLSNTSIIHINPNGTFGPGLATSWGYLKSKVPNENFEFTLRQGVRFSDGTPVTAKAVAIWLNYFAKQPGLYQAQMGTIKSIAAVGNSAVEIQLATPNTLVPYLLSEAANWGAVESPYAVAHPSLMATESFGAGPYMIDPSQTVANSQYTFVPNPYYSGKSGDPWSRVVVKIILANPSSMLDAIETGQVAVAAGDITTAAAAAKAGLDVVTVANGDGGLLFYNRNQGKSNPLGSVLVREALNYAVNRPAICQALYGTYAKPATSGMPATDAALPSNYTFPYTYDPSKAKALLAQAGYPHGFTIKMLAYAPLGVDGTEMPQAIAQEFQAIGVNMNITTGTSASQYVEDNATKQYPIESNTLGLRPLEQDYGFVYAPKGALNPFGSVDSVLSGLYAKSTTATTSSSVSSYLDQIVQRITAQAYSVNVCTKPRLWYVSKNIGGASLNGLSTAPLASELYPK